MRTDIKGFFAADSSQGAGGHVANRIAASLAGSDANVLQLAQHLWNVLDRDVVVLNILAGGDVAHAAGVFLGNVAESRELLRGHPAAGQLHANHVRVRSANAVHAMFQTDGLEHFRIEFAAPESVDQRDEAVIFGDIFPAIIGRDWYVRDGHKSFLPTKNLPKNTKPTCQRLLAVGVSFRN